MTREARLRFAQRMNARHRRDQITTLVGGATGLAATLVAGLTVPVYDLVTAALLGLGILGACVLATHLLVDRVVCHRARRSSVSRGTRGAL